MTVGITDLVHTPGLRRPVKRDVVIDDLSITTAHVPAAAAIELDLTLEAVSNGVVVTGNVTVPWVGECRRCLGDVVGTSTAKIREIFERRPTEGETYALGETFADLEPMVRDTALMVLPLAPLCGQDCPGPAPDVFPAYAASPDVEESLGKLIDPRWKALDQLKFE